jgi:hypothetical protein
MHRRLVEELIAEEVERAYADDLLRGRVELEQRRTRVLVRARRPETPVLFAFDGPNYNAQPFQFMVLDSDTEEPLPGPAWPPGLYFGSNHPSLARAWTCTRGTYEYFKHSSHVADSWDQYRYSLDLPTLLRHLLNKAGCS